ncbi:MAG: hypothetical protein ABSE73_10315 [Planctomycetota bacterium]
MTATNPYVTGDGAYIVCTTPAHAAGPVDVVVTNPDGQSVTLTQGLTYTAPTPLYKDVPVSGSTGNSNVWQDTPYYFDVPAGVTSVTIKTSNTNADVLDMGVNEPHEREEGAVAD